MDGRHQGHVLSPDHGNQLLRLRDPGPSEVGPRIRCVHICVGGGGGSSLPANLVLQVVMATSP